MLWLGTGDDERPDERPVARLLPALSLLICTALAVMPLGLPNHYRFVMVMLPLMAVFYWTVNGRGIMPSLLVAGAGLVIDLVTFGPIGFWSLIFLIAQMFATWVSGPLTVTALGRWACFAVIVAMLGAVQWLTASVYFMQLAAWQPHATGALIVVMVYPVFAFVVRPRFR